MGAETLFTTSYICPFRHTFTLQVFFCHTHTLMDASGAIWGTVSSPQKPEHVRIWRPKHRPSDLMGKQLILLKKSLHNKLKNKQPILDQMHMHA